MMGQTMMAALSGAAATPGEDPMVQLGKLHDLFTKGVITQAEFDMKKAELLKKIG
jgi:hypothetical protein